jgi:hypothetical protein
MKLDELKAGKVLRGPIFPEPVQVIVVVPMGDGVKLKFQLRLSFKPSFLRRIGRQDCVRAASRNANSTGRHTFASTSNAS